MLAREVKRRIGAALAQRQQAKPIAPQAPLRFRQAGAAKTFCKLIAKRFEGLDVERY